MPEDFNQEDAERRDRARRIAQSPEAQEIKADLDRYKGLGALADSAGGKELTRLLRKDMATDIETIMALFRGDEMELRCAVAKLISHLGVYRVLLNADENAKLASDALEELLKKH